MGLAGHGKSRKCSLVEIATLAGNLRKCADGCCKRNYCDEQGFEMEHGRGRKTVSVVRCREKERRVVDKGTGAHAVLLRVESSWFEAASGECTLDFA